jgi:hypothetical protein
MEDLTQEELNQLIIYYKNKCHELEYSLLITQLKVNKLSKEVAEQVVL